MDKDLVVVTMEDKTFNRIFGIAITIILLTFARVATVGINHLKICDAIYAYQVSNITKHEEWLVTYKDMEDFTDTYLRLWDWSYKRILSDEDYRTIKPYIGEDIYYGY